jgi:hypothetical protein
VNRLLRRRRDDRGVAMVYAVALAVMSMSLLAGLAGYATSESLQSGTFRQGGQALAAAEGQVDVAIARIVTGAAAGSLPCTATTFTDATTGVDAVAVTTTVTYADAGGVALACPVPAGVAVASALVRAVATGTGLVGAGRVRRVVEATLAIGGGGGAAQAGGSFSRTVFAEDLVSFANGVVLSQQAGAGTQVPSVYTNADFQCNNSMQVSGSLIVQGRTTFAGDCRVSGDLQSTGDVQVHNLSAQLGRDVLVSNGSVGIVSGTTVGGTVRASGSITWNGCPARCFPGAPVPPAPRESLPALPWNATVRATWQAAGWDVVTFDNPSDCTLLGAANAPGQWLLDNGSVVGTKTVLHTVCRLVLQPSNSTISMSRDLALIADGGVQISNALRFSGVGATRSLYLVQPSTGAAAPCTTGVNLDNQVVIDSSVSTFIYSPCDVRVANAFTFGGQVYTGGKLRFDNAVTLQYRPMPIPGQQPSGSTSSTYTVQVTGKRQNSV